MQLLAGPHAALPAGLDGTVATVGTFDGVHRGHLDVLDRLVARARAAGLPSLLVTFEPHPLQLVNPSAAPRLLTSREEKLELLGQTDLDLIAILPFDRPLADLSAEQFVDQVLRQRFRLRELFVGHDHGFGRGREGDAATLRRLGEARGFAVHVVAPVPAEGGGSLSSSQVRRAVAAGRLDEAAAALGRRYSVRGPVVRGEARGRALGYPTINVLPDTEHKLLPPDGVYAVTVGTGQGKYGGMLNLGGRPTFHDDRRTIEAHLFGAAGDFYGDVVRVGFVARLRDTMQFSGADALMAQLADDERAARDALTASVGPGNLKGFMQFPPSTP